MRSGNLVLKTLLTPLSVAVLAGFVTPAVAAPCDHACLENIGNEYLAAYLKHDPSMAPISKKVRYSENNVLLKFPDGTWDTVTSDLGGTLIFSDPKTGGVGIFTATMQTKTPGYLAIRLKVVDGKITEIEHMMATKRFTAGVFVDPTTLPAPVNYPDMARVLAPNERVSRAKMIEVANGYYNTLEHNDGTLRTKFGPNCQRSENGGDTSVSRGGPGGPGGPGGSADAAGATAQPVAATSTPPMASPNPPAKVDPATAPKNTCWYGFTTSFYSFNNRVRDRDYMLVDEDKGLVLARGYIDHKGVMQKGFLEPQTWSLFELFKVENGDELGPIRADFIQVPYYTASVWPTAQPRPDQTPDIPDYKNIPPKH